LKNTISQWPPDLVENFDFEHDSTGLKVVKAVCNSARFATKIWTLYYLIVIQSFFNCDGPYPEFVTMILVNVLGENQNDQFGSESLILAKLLCENQK
jgi:hypothetical protein